MTRARMAAIGGAVAALAIGFAAVAGAAPQPPRLGYFPEPLEAAVRAARASQATERALPADRGCVSVDALASASPLEPGVEAFNGDNLGTHYARGNTLVVIVFVNDSQVTWTLAQQQAKGALAKLAKDYYLANAPATANLSFDNQGTTNYYFYVVDSPRPVGFQGMTTYLTDSLLVLLGFDDDDGDGGSGDEATLYLQAWNGGWDNVILSFAPHSNSNGSNWARQKYSVCSLYFDAPDETWAHEWGHLFGSCDEDATACDSSLCNVDCAFADEYRDAAVENGNCPDPCGPGLPCIMADPHSLTDICDFTLDGWGWNDANSDGVLDTHKRRVTGSTFVDIRELRHDTPVLTNDVTNGWVYAQTWTSWAVAGVRSPGSANYNLTLYADNNHNFQYASSAFGGTTVDFVVGDYNHNRLGNEHLEVDRASGDAANYRIHWESGTGSLYPDGVVRSFSLASSDVVQVWEVPLFASEWLTFTLDITSGTPDLGMALYRSNGAAYWSSRLAAQASADAGGAGVTETFTYLVPADDVYGLVVWSNVGTSGTFTVKIGPTPAALAEETPFYSAFDLRLFSYQPNASAWAFAGTRPDPGTEVTLRLFADSQNQTELEISDDYGPGQIEFVAVDYNHLSTSFPDYLRVVRLASPDNHRTEWEQDDEILPGAVSGTWVMTHLGKVWDAYLTAGQSYLFREYHDPAEDLDTELYVFSSSDGDYYKPRTAYAGAANFRTPAAGGEWFSYTAPATDWYGVVLLVNDESDGPYGLWMGPKVTLGEEVVTTRADEVMFGTASVTTPHWTAFGVRPAAGEIGSIWLYGDAAYTPSTLAVEDKFGFGVNYVVGDYNHNPTGLVYPRFRRATGLGELDAQWEGGPETLEFTAGGANLYDLNWPARGVVNAHDLYIDGGAMGGRDVAIVVSDLSGAMDLGIALFKSSGAEYYAVHLNAVERADAEGAGGTEIIRYQAVSTDWYGLVVFNQNDAGGAYRIQVLDAAAVGVAEAPPVAFALRASPNPAAGPCQVRYGLPRSGPSEVAVYDIQGRRVRLLVEGERPAGDHATIWDGRDDAGRPVGDGLYLVRLRAGGEERRIKLVRAR
jgi:hypothetical protein